MRLLDECLDLARSSTHGDWISVAPAATTSSPDGPLAGVPFSVKDNIDVAGFPTTAGSRLLPDVAVAVDASVVDVLRNAGAVVVGKTNMHELALGITGNNSAFGPVRNPADASRSAGGSGGGSAVGVALGVVPFALGTDTGGSTTIPASFRGVVGFRPTTDRYAGDGVVTLSSTRDTIGVHARTVEEVRTVDEVITGERRRADLPPGVEGLRVGVVRCRFEDVDTEVGTVARAALSALADAGARMVDVDVRDDFALSAGPGIDLVLFEAVRLIRPRLADQLVAAPVQAWASCARPPRCTPSSAVGSGTAEGPGVRSSLSGHQARGLPPSRGPARRAIRASGGHTGVGRR